MSFTFATAGRIVFGRGTARQLPDLVLPLGRSPLLVTGKGAARHEWLFRAFEARGTPLAHFAVEREPTVDDARAVVRLGRQHSVDVVLGLGGGSALDLAKAAAALIPAPGDALDYLEVVGRGQQLPGAGHPGSALPSVLCSTTAGTGAEVTKNAVLDATEQGVKVSLRGESLLARIAVVDPELTESVPPAVTATTGFDALTQVIEPFLSHQANPLTDALCREGIRRGARSLVRAYRNGSDLDAREDLSVTSLCGGLALANAKLGAVHGFAGPLGGLFHAPHGALCAALLPACLVVNQHALRERAPQARALARLDELGVLLTGRPNAGTADAIAFCQDTSRALGIPGLRSFGVERAHFSDIVQKARRSSSMQGNPIELTPAELETVLEQSL